MNWQQELAAEVTAIDDINANTATLTYRINDQGGFFGGVDKIIEIQRQIKVKSPESMAERLADGVERRLGDLVCKVAYSQLYAAHTPQNSDPVITVNGVVKTLEEVRPFNFTKGYKQQRRRHRQG